MRLAGKVAIVTGASSGIGREIAIRFSREGAKVAITARDLHRLEETEQEIKKSSGECIRMLADLGKVSNMVKVVDETVSRSGQLDILVNCAGIFLLEDFLKNSEEMYDRTMAVNVKSQFFMCQKAALKMKERGKGKIINLSSIAGGTVGFPTAVAYCASKAAISGMTKALAVELAQYRICVNAILPGNIRTPMNEGLLANEDYYKAMISMTPLKYIEGPSVIGGLACFLASDESDYVTGSDFVVDGGWTVN